MLAFLLFYRGGTTKGSGAKVCVQAYKNRGFLFFVRADIPVAEEMDDIL